jgi:redox-sensitive bicupin YhaK (pirin superfamily)
MGEGHTAVPVVEPNDFARTDPFILLMDDRMDLPPGKPAGGAHPHGGFETVTFVVEGSLRDRDEGNLEEGDILWMTAGSGVIHNEDVEPLGRSRILQLWLTLPQSARWSAPRFELVKRDAVPVIKENGVEARLYSGTSGSLRAATHNYVPVTLLDIRLQPGATFEQELPNSYNGFVFVDEGSVSIVGEQLKEGQVGWLDDRASESSDQSVVRIKAGDNGARVILYAGERQNVPIVSHGPFIAESRADLMRLSRLYMEGKMPGMSELSKIAAT